MNCYGSQTKCYRSRSLFIIASVCLGFVVIFAKYHHHCSPGSVTIDDGFVDFKSGSYNQLVKHIRKNVLIPPPVASERRKQNPGKYYSQLGQDKFANDKVFKNRTNGIYIEAGAYNGVGLSNTLFFEETFNWTGLLVEPDPMVFQQLKGAKRNAWLLNGCLGSHKSKIQHLTLNTNVNNGAGALAYLQDFGNRHLIFADYIKNEDQITVQCYPLNLVLEAIGWQHIDYFSLDVEGAESAVIHSIDYGRFSFGLIDIECNNCVNSKGEWANVAGQDMLAKRHYIKKHLEYEGYQEVFYLDQDIFYIQGIK